MTPYGHKLRLALSLERERMLNEWFFKWHQIGYQNSVEIDSFDGQKIIYGGISFWGTPREIYWQTLSRYLRKKIDECFNELEQLLALYPNSAARDAIEDAENELNTFVHQIGNDAIEKDRVLQGDASICTQFSNRFTPPRSPVTENRS